MAFKAELNLDSLKGVKVIDFSYSLGRDVDASGRPSGAVKGGTIQVTIESTKSTFLFEWMTTPTKRKEGTITIMADDQDGSMKEIKFKDGYIVDYGENYHWQGGENMLETFTVSAKEITVGGGTHENEWPES